MPRLSPGRMLQLSLALHLLAAVFSTGFYHSDEHFQILEFMNHWLGRSLGSDLPIEFHEHLRPWLQPLFYGTIARFWQGFGIQSPFFWAFSFRLVTALVGWFTLVFLARMVRIWVSSPIWRNWSVAALCFAWFMPAFHARLSSENLSGSVFFIAACGYLLRANAGTLSFPVSLATGLLLGASFELRYQAGFMIGGFLLWLFFFQPLSRRYLLPIASGMLAAFALGEALDRIGYGEWTLAPWNYFHYNLILGHVADIDTQPIWDFFRSSLTETWPPLGLLLLVGTCLGWLFHPRHVLTWMTLPLFLVHCVIGHKELRFLFPIAHVAPLLLVLGLAGVSQRLGRLSGKWEFLLKPLFLLLALDNGAGLLALSVVPAWMPARFYAEIYDLAREVPELTLYYKDKDPYNVLGTQLNYYRPRNLTEEFVPDFQALERVEARVGHPIYFFHPGYPLPPEADGARCQEVYSTLPQFLHLPRAANWVLYRCG